MLTLKKTKSLTRITHEWDVIAELRDEQICSGKDHSANFVLAPAILNEIPKVNYTLWNPGYSFASIISNAREQINLNSNFKGIREVVDLLEKYRKEEVPLNIVKYKEMQDKLKEVSKRLENYSKIPTGLAVKSLLKDSIEAGSDTTNISRQKEFIKAIGNDIYIDETVKVINKIIGEAALVQRK